jgi:hypothetical protein
LTAFGGAGGVIGFPEGKGTSGGTCQISNPSSENIITMQCIGGDGTASGCSGISSYNGASSFIGGVVGQEHKFKILEQLGVV